MTRPTRRVFLSLAARAPLAAAGSAFAARTALAAGASLATGGLFCSRLALSAPVAGSSADAERARLVVVLLRGALDGLSAVVPHGDPAYASLRRELTIAAPRASIASAGEGDASRSLDATFALHPSLAFLHERYRAGEFTALHAVATPYRERSHFDAQELLENGGVRPHAHASGWLNRALTAAGSRDTPGASDGVALGANIPLMMRGATAVASWSPSRLAMLDDDTLQRLSDLYSEDPILARRLADALSSDAIATAAVKERNATPPEDSGAAARSARAGAARFGEIMRAAAGFLRQPAGPRVATLETSGWDTHANQGAVQGALALRLAALDGALRALHEALGPAWSRTAVLLVTEFGRTAAVNGTRGTDHGTGGVAMLVGGAVRGGRVIADWPSLAPAALHERRDLRPTLDLRAVCKGLLHDHLRVPTRALDRDVFPGSEGVVAVRDLIKA
jgi:uncharacterized protein (DUF1501 family)